MAKNREAKIKFTAETGEFNDAIRKSNGEMSKLRAELKLNDTQMEAAGRSAEGLKKKHELLENQQKATQAKTEALTSKIQSAVKWFGENSEEVTRLERQLAIAKAEEAKIEMAIAQCNDELEEQARGFKLAGDNAEAASEGFTVFKGAMADLVADGIETVVSGLGNIGTEAFTMANDIDEATNTFIAQTGESTSSAEEFEEIMKSIYGNNFGESFEDIAGSMATVKTAMGDLGTAELEKVTTDALILRDTFDLDVNESVRAVNSMMDQFGITADEAFSLVAQGAQNGLNQNGDLLDVVNEYAVQFKNAGYSADDMFNMLSNGVQAGTWSVDKLGDSVKEFNIRMSDGSAKDAVEALGFSWEKVSESWSKGGDDAKDTFNMLMAELSGLENTTEGYNIGVGLMGTMFEDLGYDAVAALSSTSGEISKSKDALGEINAVKYDDVGSALEGIKRNLMTSISDPLNEDVLPALSGIAENVDWEGVGSTISSGMGIAIEAVMSFVGGVKTSVTWMKEHQGVVVAVASVIGILATAIAAYNVVQGVKNAMDAVGATTVWGLVAAHWAQATAAMAAIAPYVLVVAAIAAVIAIIVLCIKHWDDIVAAVKKCIAKMSEAWKSFTKWLDASVIKPVLNWFKNLWNGITNTFSNVGSWFREKFAAAKDGVMNAWSNVKDKFSSIKTGIVDAFSNIKEKISQPFEKARDAVKNVVDKIKGFFSGMKLSLPKIKLPHFKITGKLSLNPPSIPKLSIDWYKDGGVMMSPTIFGVNGNRLMAGGEAGPEAIAPISTLESYVSDAVEKAMQAFDMSNLASAIADLANRPVQLNVNGRQFATATAGDGDRVNGLRTSFKSRGLIVD